VAIRQFEVGPLRGLSGASASELPNLVGIAGANGSGKSALIEQLWNQRLQFAEPGTELQYVGPHRTWRSGALSDIVVRGIGFDFGDVLKQDNIPGFQYGAPGGLNFMSGLRRLGSNADDAQALVKAAIVRIANRSQTLVSQEFRRQGSQIAPDTVPDLFEPFRRLIERLLPHLSWQGVDDSNVNDIRVQFRSVDSITEAPLFDIDDLSSGEKAAIALFLPFIERSVKRLVGESSDAPAGIVPITTLIDEPEIHLHPLLQLNVLAYMRELAADAEAQFIFTTHSPTVLDALAPGELFLLHPAVLAPDNQLVRLADSAEHLEAARALTGSTHLLTRSKPIVFVEGEPDQGAKASDERLLKLLVPEAAHWAVVPAHGRQEVVRSVSDMHAAELNLPGFPVFGIVDSDQGLSGAPDTVVPWDCAMIENLLLDGAAIFQALGPYTGVGPGSVEGVDRVLMEIATARREDEIRLRFLRALPSGYLRLSATDLAALEAEIQGQAEAFRLKVSAVDTEKALADATAEVDEIVAQGAEMARFRGKEILRTFFDQQGVHASGMGLHVFVTEVARHAASNERARELTSKAVAKIRLYVPLDLAGSVEAAPPTPARDQLVVACRTHRESWELGAPDAAGRADLRDRLFQFARGVRDGGAPDVASGIMRQAVGIGLPS
jgi:hypothetical protein